jgi:hypothetical protein
MTNARQLARKIVDDIADDIQDRKGIGNEFEEIDEAVRQAMLLEWIDIAEAHIRAFARKEENNG